MCLGSDRVGMELALDLRAGTVLVQPGCLSWASRKVLRVPGKILWLRIPCREHHLVAILWGWMGTVDQGLHSR